MATNGNPPVWAVRLHDDDLNSEPGVVYALNRVLGMSLTAAMFFASASNNAKKPEVIRRSSDRAAAEELAAELQAYGLHVTLREE